MPERHPDSLARIPEAIRRLSCSRPFLYKMAAAGEIEIVKLGHASFVRNSDIDRLIEHGTDFDEARLEAARLAKTEGLLFAPTFHPDLVVGVATWALELFRAVGGLEALYVPSNVKG